MTKSPMPLKTLKVVCLVFHFHLPLLLVGTPNSDIILRSAEVTDKTAEVWCKFQPNGYDCKESGMLIPYYYFDMKLEDCIMYNFGDCDNEKNKFDHLKDCRETCLEPGMHELSGNMSASLYCRFQPKFGSCQEYHPKWYYDMTTRSCKGFSFSGCGGNLNRFSTAQICIATCGPAMDHHDVEME